MQPRNAPTPATSAVEQDVARQLRHTAAGYLPSRLRRERQGTFAREMARELALRRKYGLETSLQRQNL